jgi:hypothetical protein
MSKRKNNDTCESGWHIWGVVSAVLVGTTLLALSTYWVSTRASVRDTADLQERVKELEWKVERSDRRDAHHDRLISDIHEALNRK